MESTARVETCIARARGIRAEALAELDDHAPNSLNRGKELNAALTKLAEKWPAWSEENARMGGWEAEVGVASDEARKLLVGARVEDVISAQLADLGDKMVFGWSRSPVWVGHVRFAWEHEHAKEIADFAEAHIRATLEEAGVEGKLIDSYLAALANRELDDFVEYPFQRTTEEYKLTGQELTTDFILNAAGYDRGEMWAVYIMEWERLGALDTSRLRDVLPVLLGSEDDNVRWLAAMVIRQAHSVDVVNAYMDSIALHPEDTAAALAGDRDPVDRDRKLLAILAKLDPNRQAPVWKALTERKCDSEALRHEAQARLDDIRAGRISDAADLQAALEAYLGEHDKR